MLHDQTEIERVEKTRRDFIANVSHELRTPLTSIQGYTETLLEADGITGTSRDFLEIIRKNAARMARLTEDLLVLARVESGERNFTYEMTSPQDLLQRRAADLSGHLRKPRRGAFGRSIRRPLRSSSIAMPFTRCSPTWWRTR